MKSSLKLFTLFVLFSTILSCPGFFSDKDASEKSLLAAFKKEKKDLETYQEQSYVSYMNYQVSHFKKKQRKISALIAKTNENFKKMSSAEQYDYQIKWQKEFQPVVTDIYELTRKLIVRQTADLTPENMAEIQELTIEMQNLEKESPDAKLIPNFFKTPNINDDQPKDSLQQLPENATPE